MKTSLKNRIRAAAALAALLLIPAVAYASGFIDTKKMAASVRGEMRCYTNIPETANTDVTNGVAGLIGSTTINAVTAPSLTQATLYGMLHPARLSVYVFDGGADNPSALSCTTVTVVGVDQFGVARREVFAASVALGATTAFGTTLSQVTETPALTNYVYSSVTSVTGSGCVNGAAANDTIRVEASQHLGLMQDIRVWSDVESVCMANTTNPQCVVANDGTSFDIQSLVDADRDSFNADSGPQYGSAKTNKADLDSVCIRIRSSVR